MTLKQADKLIADGRPVKLRSKEYDEIFTGLLVSRDRTSVYTEQGTFNRADLEIVEDPNQ
jgi:hypothetical protein